MMSLLPNKLKLYSILMVSWIPSILLAQVSNQEIYSQLAQKCLIEIPSSLEAFSLSTNEAFPFIQTRLLEAWKIQDKQVYLTGSSIPNLAFEINTMKVNYKFVSKSKMERTIHFETSYILTDGDKKLLDANHCTDSYSDTILSTDIASIENQLIPATIGEKPVAHSRSSRILTPALLIGAISTSVYLLFKVRSQSNSSTDG